MTEEESSVESVYSYDLEERTEEPPLPSIELEFLEGRKFLEISGPSNQSVWGHLTEVLSKILKDRPDNVIEYFEEYSRQLKEEKFKALTDHLHDVYMPPPHYDLAKQNIALLQSVNVTEIGEDIIEAIDEEAVESIPSKLDLIDMMLHFEQAGIGMPKEEIFLLQMVLRKITQTDHVVKARFWGKIFGLKKNYYVVECELTEEAAEEKQEEVDKAEEERKKAEEEALAAQVAAQTERENKLNEEALALKEKERELKKQAQDLIDKENAEKNPDWPFTVDPNAPVEPQFPLLKKYEMPPLPQPIELKVVHTPNEKIGEGINKKVFYASNDISGEWTLLPDVTPQQIVVARQMRKYFTGILDAPIVSFPKFPGDEKNYLRAQIGRISAGTQISPLGFYTFEQGEEEEAEEEGETAKTNYVENPDFEPVPLRDLMDPSMSYWVHHTLHILKQGRTVWWNPKSKEDEEEAEPEFGEEEEEQTEAELGPQLLTPLSEDATLEDVSPWSVRISSTFTPDLGVVLVRSNLWPGAYAFAVGKKFDNIYIGWGHKFVSYGYTPPNMPHPEYMYDLGPEILEIDDPTPEVEEEWRLAHEKKPPELGEGEELGEEEEGAGDEEDE